MTPKVAVVGGIGSWLKDVGKQVRDAVKSVTKHTNNILQGTGVYTALTGDLAGGAGLAGTLGSANFYSNMSDSDWYKMMEGYIPGTDINPIDRYLGKDVAKMNYEQQQKAYEYQKWLNEQHMSREDEAYQRKLKDMTAAGFNPILASGGSGEATSPLRAGSAPQMADTSEGLRGVVGQALSLMSGFAGLAKTKAETSLLKTQEDYQRIINQFEAEHLSNRNAGERLANNFANRTFQTRVDLLLGDKSKQDLEITHNEFMLELDKLGIKKATLDNIYSELGITDLQTKIKLDTLALLYKTEEYEAYKFSRNFYENRWNVPTGFNLSTLVGALVGVGSGLGKVVKNFLKDVFPGKEPESRNSFGFGGTGASRSFEVDNFIPFDPDENTSASLTDVLRSFVYSTRRGADGVRRNQYSVMFDLMR